MMTRSKFEVGDVVFFAPHIRKVLDGAYFGEIVEIINLGGAGDAWVRNSTDARNGRVGVPVREGYVVEYGDGGGLPAFIVEYNLYTVEEMESNLFL